MEVALYWCFSLGLPYSTNMPPGNTARGVKRGEMMMFSRHWRDSNWKLYQACWITFIMNWLKGGWKLCNVSYNVTTSGDEPRFWLASLLAWGPLWCSGRTSLRDQKKVAKGVFGYFHNDQSHHIVIMLIIMHLRLKNQCSPHFVVLCNFCHTLSLLSQWSEPPSSSCWSKCSVDWKTSPCPSPWWQQPFSWGRWPTRLKYLECWIWS